MLNSLYSMQSHASGSTEYVLEKLSCVDKGVWNSAAKDTYRLLSHRLYLLVATGVEGGLAGSSVNPSESILGAGIAL